MKSQGYLFASPAEIPNIIHNASVAQTGELLCLLHVTKQNEADVLRIITILDRELPNCKIAGTTAPFVIYYGKLYNDKSIIEFIETQNTMIQTEVFDQSVNTPLTLAEKISEFAVRPDTKIMLNFFSGAFAFIPEYLEALAPRIGDVKIAGGLVGDTDFGPGFIFTRTGIYHDSTLTVSFHNSDIYAYNNMFIGMDIIHEAYEMTETEDQYITAIDGFPAVEWLRSILGVDVLHAPDLSPDGIARNVLMKFPFEFDDERGVARIINFDPDTERIYVYNKRPAKNQKFRLAYINSESIAAAAQRICADLSHTPIEMLLCYSCLTRAGLEGCCAEWELAPLTKAGICGCLLMGEIGNVPELAGNRSLNETCTIITAAENRRYVSINANLLSNRRIAEDSHREIWNHVLRFQNRSIAEKNDILKNAIIDMKIDPDYYDSFKDFSTKRPSLKRFIKDNETYRFDKVCLIVVERGHIAQTHFGPDVYGKIIAKNIGSFEHYLSLSFPEAFLPIYVYDENSFLIAGAADIDPTRFLCVMQELFIKYGTVNVLSLSYTCIHRFIAVKEQQPGNLIEELRAIQSRNAETPDRFIVYEAETEQSESVSDAFKKTKLITEAIENDGIVPYFQPIYDNKTGRIEKFEALIRLRGSDGRIYFPGQFLESAKEYRLYLQLSEIMIGKVFDMFENRTETVSINLSAYDINSAHIRNMIYNRLEKIKNADRFIFEVLESEEFRDFEVLTHFIERVRRYGVQIAIDDFGAGFSNLLEIAKISPNFIKIDGQIVREVVESEIHRKIMDAILHLAQSFGIELIAEYIENAALQAYAKDKGVRYSQGYFFSPPIPYASLEDFKLREDSTV
ncbi:MAG: EAL domain-containing protein [Ruminococcus sp.]|jgi:EAL domain-containing protein (putative c-di-GMP-specific phosphodiesterase class I)|nr:EAL domain-containing protein [Ruminococcus sp.]